MGLHFSMNVNGRSIGYVHIQRRANLVPGQPSKYQAEVEYPLGKLTKIDLEHDYDDGALVLISKALMAVDLLREAPQEIVPSGQCEHSVPWRHMPQSHWAMFHKVDHP